MADKKEQPASKDYRQTLPVWLRQLTNEQIDSLATYQHKAGKTTYESWLQGGICKAGEQAFPNFLSANSLTLIGQAPLFLLVLYVFATTGTGISHENSLPLSMMVIIGIVMQWFTLVDIMDGNRARRLKVGSPLGRLIDEGGDTITMANYCVLIAYAWRLNNPFFELLYLSLNSVFFAMEIKYIITGKLVMDTDDISPVEVETLLAIILVSMGTFGDSFLTQTIGSAFGIPAGSKCPLHVVCDYQWSTLIGVCCFLLAVFLVYDAIIDSLKADAKKAIYLFSPVLACNGLYFAYTTLPCYEEQRGLVILFVNYVLASITLDLMVYNMTKKPFYALQPVLVLLLIPLVAHHVFKVDAVVERILPQILAVVAFIFFMVKIGTIAKQWVDFTGRPFWYVPKEHLKTILKAE